MNFHACLQFQQAALVETHCKTCAGLYEGAADSQYLFVDRAGTHGAQVTLHGRSKLVTDHCSLQHAAAGPHVREAALCALCSFTYQDRGSHHQDPQTPASLILPLLKRLGKSLFGSQ